MGALGTLGSILKDPPQRAPHGSSLTAAMLGGPPVACCAKVEAAGYAISASRFSCFECSS